MPWSEQIPIQKHMTRDELESRIKTLEKDTKILKRLYFVKYRYDGESVGRNLRKELELPGMKDISGNEDGMNKDMKV